MLITKDIHIPKAELRLSFARSSGAGGQNVNKVNSKAILRWAVRANRSLPKDVRQRFVLKYQHRISTTGDLILTSQKYRDQVRNIEDCITKLTSMVLTIIKPPTARIATKPTVASQQRRIEVKRTTAYKKQLRSRPLAEE
jgi:ribosome-associated protein